jgi:penicillin amidase
MVTGYLQAQDRLWQMDLLRRVTQGRLSEIFGEDMVKTDQLFRALRIDEKSRMVYQQTDPGCVQNMEAFARGVNAFIEEYSGKLPFEFTVLGYFPEPWTTLHSMNAICFMAWNLSLSWSTEILLYKISQAAGAEKAAELLPDVDLQRPIFPDFMADHPLVPIADLLAAADRVQDLGLEVFSGSNNWVVSGDNNTTGKPIVCNDMHLGLDNAPGIWYQMHQHVPGRLHVSGVVLPGAPYIVCGHNDSIAWGMTNVMLDDMDFYLETLNPADTNQYLLNGQWRDLKVTEEEILIKGGDKVTLPNRFTHRGPIIGSFRGVDDRALSMRWIGNEYSNEMQATYMLNRASTLDDFREAVRAFVSIGQNIVYGDVEGNIGLFCCAGIPIHPGNRAFVMPGDTSLYDWQGWVPFEELPHRINPPDGFLVSANNRTTGPEYSHHISHWFELPDRYNRIVELLEGNLPATPGFMERIQADQKSKWAEKVMSLAGPLLDQALLGGTAAAVYDMFGDWDYQMDMEAIEPAVFEVFYLQLLEAIFHDELGDQLMSEFLKEDRMARYVIDRIADGQKVSWCDDMASGDRVETIDDLVIPSWEAAIDWLMIHYGENPGKWIWGNMHQISFNHALGRVNLLKKIFKLERGPFPAGGSYHTVCPFSYSMGNGFAVNSGASQRHIFTAADWDRSRIVMPTGISGIPASRFYCNQTGLYLSNGYMNESFSRERVLGTAAYRSVFTGTLVTAVEGRPHPGND